MAQEPGLRSKTRLPQHKTILTQENYFRPYQNKAMKSLLALLCLSLLLSCQSATTETTTEAAEAAESAEVEEKAIPEEILEESSLAEWVDYMDFSNKQGTHLRYEAVAQGRAKHNFEYKDNFYSLDVNDDGITYLAVYEKTESGNVLHFVSITPESDGEGSSFINYDNEPYRDYFYEKNELQTVLLNTPEDGQSFNDLEGYDAEGVKALGDSIRDLMQGFFQLDSSTTQFGGSWNYLKNSEDYNFSLDLEQMGSFVRGEYCAYTQSKNDCGVPEQGGDPCFVNGYLQSDTLHLTFKSCYSGKTGTALLYLEGDSSVWKNLYNPEGSLAPSRAVLGSGF